MATNEFCSSVCASLRHQRVRVTVTDMQRKKNNKRTSKILRLKYLERKSSRDALLTAI
jgi:hypothetical protein